MKMNQKVFIVKVRKEEVENANMIPRHPEFSYAGSLSENIWEAKNTHTDKLVCVMRIDKGDFYEYEIEHVEVG